MENKYALGIDIGGTNIKLGIVTNQGDIIETISVPTKREDGPEEVISQLKKGIKNILENDIKINGIGIGAAGSVSAEKGTVSNPPNVPGWGVVDLVHIIKDEFNISVFIDNDANAAAIGEMLYGAGKDHNSFALVTLGTGVGGGIILNRKIYRGDTGAAGEIGHITIDFDGRMCKCGSKGCIEAYVGNHYLMDIVKEELTKHQDSKILDLINNNTNLLTPKIINEAAFNGDEYALNIIERVGFYVGVALTSVSNLLEIDTFIIGGGVSAFGDPLLKSIKNTIEEKVLKVMTGRIKVLPALLKNNAGIVGASSLVFYNS